jgi:hypothetical protein
MAVAETGSSLIAWWGAGLSTLLAVVKLFELWRDRFRVDVSYNFTGNESIGNEILIRNLSSRPLILAYWELLLLAMMPNKTLKRDGRYRARPLALG